MVTAYETFEEEAKTVDDEAFGVHPSYFEPKNEER